MSSILVTYPRILRTYDCDASLTGEWTKPSNEIAFAKMSSTGQLLYRQGESLLFADQKAPPRIVNVTEKVTKFDVSDRNVISLTPNSLDVLTLGLRKENSIKIPANRSCLAPNTADKSVFVGCGISGELHRISLVNYSVKEIPIIKQPTNALKSGILQIAPIHASQRKLAILRGEKLAASEAAILDVTKGVVSAFPHPSLAPTKALRCSPVTDTLCFTAGYDKTIKLYDTREVKMISRNTTDLIIQYADFVDAQKIAFTCIKGGVYMIDLRNSDKITTIAQPVETGLVKSSITLDPTHRASTILAELENSQEKPKRDRNFLEKRTAPRIQSPLVSHSTTTSASLQPSANTNIMEVEQQKITTRPKPVLREQVFPSFKENQQVTARNEDEKQETATLPKVELAKITGLLETLVSKVSAIEQKVVSLDQRIEKLEAPVKETRHLITFPMESDSARPLQADMRAQVTDPLKRKIERLELFQNDANSMIKELGEMYIKDNDELRAAVQNLAEQIERARQPMNASQLVLPDWRT